MSNSPTPRPLQSAGVLLCYLDGPFDMDHPWYQARMQAALDAQWCAQAGDSWPQTRDLVMARCRQGYGDDVPVNLVQGTAFVTHLLCRAIAANKARNGYSGGNT